MMIQEDQKPCVTIVGAGAVGTALAVHLKHRGYPIVGILSRQQAHASRLASQVQVPLASDRMADLPPETRFVLCCVSDRAIGAVAHTLAQVVHPWPETTVAHTSGLLTAQVLDPLRQKGATTLSFHPLQTFARSTPPSSLEQVFIGVEGEAAALAFGKALAVDLGARYVTIPSQAKAAYHLAASVASNFFVTLIALVQEILNGIGMEGETGAALMQPLIEQTWRNLLQTAPEQALTGPIVRGDVVTVDQHSRVVQEWLPHLVPVYTALGIETVRLAVRSGRLDALTADALLEALGDLIEQPGNAAD